MFKLDKIHELITRNEEKVAFTLFAGLGAGMCVMAHRDFKQADILPSAQLEHIGYRERDKKQADARGMFWLGLSTAAIGALGVVKPEALVALDEALNPGQQR